MLASFVVPEDSKSLYFYLSNSFNLSADVLRSRSYRHGGVYVIFKKSICYYVGQSLNLASRLSTHLTGKYSEADEVRLFLPGSNDFLDFYERSKQLQKEILENNECFAINHFVPIENIMVERDKEVPQKNLFFQFQFFPENDERYPSFLIYFKDGFMTIANDTEEVACIDDRITGPYIDENIAVHNYFVNKAAQNNG